MRPRGTRVDTNMLLGARGDVRSPALAPERPVVSVDQSQSLTGRDVKVAIWGLAAHRSLLAAFAVKGGCTAHDVYTFDWMFGRMTSVHLNWVVDVFFYWYIYCIFCCCCHRQATYNNPGCTELPGGKRNRSHSDDDELENLPQEMDNLGVLNSNVRLWCFVLVQPNASPPLPLPPFFFLKLCVCCVCFGLAPSQFHRSPVADGWCTQ